MTTLKVSIDVLRGFLTKAHIREGWRMRSWSGEDYVQEGLCQYLNIQKHYAHIDEPKHLMALFKTHWRYHIHDKSKLEQVYDGDDSLAGLEAAAVLNADDVLHQASYLSSDAQALITLFTAPGDFVDDAYRGIVFTARQVKLLAARLGISTIRVRKAAVEVLQEFTMPTPVQILATASGTLVQTGEPRAAYLIRLTQAVAGLSDEAWNALPQEAQDFFNAAAAAVNEGKPIVDVVEDKDAKPVVTNRRRASSVTSPPASGAAGTAVPVNGKAAADQMSPSARAREIMILDAVISPIDVRKKLEEEGFATPALSSLQAMRSESRAILRVLKEHGRIKDEP